MKTLLKIFGCLLIFSFSCGTKNESKLKNENEIKTEFENMLNKYKLSYSSDNRSKVTMKGGGWCKSNFNLIEVKYDIIKSNSIVSPYYATAEIHIEETQFSFNDDQKEASRSNHIRYKEIVKHLHKYSYVNSKWVVNERKHYIEGLNEWFDCNFIVTEGINKGLNNYMGCFELNFNQ